MSAVVLDAGAFIAWERGAVAVRAHLEAARRLGLPVVTTSSVVTQVWREAIDACKRNPDKFSVRTAWMADLSKLSEGQQSTLGAYNRPWK